MKELEEIRGTKIQNIKELEGERQRKKIWTYDTLKISLM